MYWILMVIGMLGTFATIVLICERIELKAQQKQDKTRKEMLVQQAISQHQTARYNKPHNHTSAKVRTQGISLSKQPAPRFVPPPTRIASPAYKQPRTAMPDSYVQPTSFIPIFVSNDEPEYTAPVEPQEEPIPQFVSGNGGNYGGGGAEASWNEPSRSVSTSERDDSPSVISSYDNSRDTSSSDTGSSSDSSD
jgi:hypothetical protein